MTRTTYLLAAAGTLALAIASPVAARDRFPLELTVKSEDGAVVADAAVHLAAASGEAFAVDGTTDRKGRFKTQLPDFSRAYLARVEKAGFEILEQTLDIGSRGFEAGTTVEVGLTLLLPDANRSFQLGLKALQDKNLALAEAKFRDAMALDAQLPGPYLGLAEVMRQQKRPDDAIAVLEQGAAAAPSTIALLDALAFSQLEQKRFDPALSSTDRALAIDPRDREALRNRYDALTGLGRAAEAEAALDALVAVDRTPDAARLLFNSGANASHAGDLELARRRFEQAIEVDATLHQAHSALAELHIQAQRWDDAVAELDRTLAIAPRNFRAWERKIEVLRAAGRTAEATAAERQLAELKKAG